MDSSMLKRFYLALAILAGLLSPALGAGTISLSLSQQFDSLGKPLNGGKLFFIQAGTTATPQNAYQDSALTIPWPNPLTLDAAGRVPQLHFADGNIKIRLTNSAGVNQVVADNILVVGASSGGGGGGSPVDATTILATGDLKPRYGTGSLSGFVRANGRTIGSATSGATERANADCQQLFQYLWDTDANLSVSTGRGASSAADWVANKTIALPDWRGRALAGLDDMGNSAASRLTSTYFGTSAIVLGAAGGSESRTLTLAQLPTGITSAVSTTTSTARVLTGDVFSNAFNFGAGGGNFHAAITQGTLASGPVASTGSATSNNTGGGAHPIVMPTMLATVYLKL